MSSTEIIEVVVDDASFAAQRHDTIAESEITPGSAAVKSETGHCLITDHEMVAVTQFQGPVASGEEWPLDGQSGTASSPPVISHLTSSSLRDRGESNVSALSWRSSGDNNDDLSEDDTEPVPLTRLHHAARDNLSKVVDNWIAHYISKGEDVKKKLDELDEHGMAPVHYAAKFNRFRILQKLHKNQANLKLVTAEEKYTPLHFAAAYVPRYKGNQAQKSYLTSSEETVKFLVNTVGIQENPKDSNNVTPLHLACRRGNLKAVLVLLEKPDIFKPDVKDVHGDTPLHQACLYGHVEVVDKLLMPAFKSFDSLRNREGQTPLHLACREGHTVIVQMLLKRCPTDMQKRLLEAHDIEGNTALHLAVESLRVAKNREPEIVRVLLDKGANMCSVKRANSKQKSKKGDDIGDRVTPLHLAARYGIVKVIRLLLDRGVFVDPVNKSNQTPLHLAAMNNQFSAVEELIERGANTEWKDVNSCTPFLLAAAHGASAVVSKLEQKEGEPMQIDKLDKNRKSAVYLAAEGAHFPLLRHLLGTRDYYDVHSMDMTGDDSPDEYGPQLSELVQISRNLCSTPDVDLNTPLHIAAKLGHLNIVEELLKDDLLKPGHVKLNARNLTNKTPAHLAAEYGHVKILDKLISKNKCFVFDEDDAGNTPLHLAACHGWKRAVKLLLDKKANIDARNAELATPLSLAAESGCLHIVKLLLQCKAEIDIQDRSRATPLHYAVKKGRTNVVKVLIQNGASCSRKDKDGCNALDHAIEAGHEDVARIIIQSDQWEGALQNTTKSHGTKEHTTPFRKLVRRMPDVAKEVLNRCTVCDRGDGESVTVYNYKYLEDFHTPTARKSPWGPLKWWINRHFKTNGYCNNWGPKSYSKSNHPLTIMAESKDSRLISHPLVISLLMFKLRKYASVVYLLSFLYHLMLVVSLTVFALSVLNPNDKICQGVFDGKHNASRFCGGEDGIDGNGTVLAQCGSPCSCGNCIRYYTAAVFAGGVLIAACIQIIILLLKLISHCRQLKIKNFVTHIQNWVELLMLICSIIFVSVFATPCLCPTSLQWQFGTVAVWLVWFNLILFIRSLQLFDIGIYVLMFGHILSTFFRTALLSLLLLVAFSLTFFMAFYRPGMEFSFLPFLNPFQTALTVMTYITGAVDYNGLFGLPHEQINAGDELPVGPPFLPISIILWVTFLIVMVILLINMLIGLAVEDIKGIKRAAEVQRLKLLVDLTLSVDSGLPYRHLFVVPERTSKKWGSKVWKRIINFLWKGKIERDTPEKIAEALANQSEPSIEQVHLHTNSLVKEVACMKEDMKALSESNRRMETALINISLALKANFGSGPNAELD